MHTVFSIWAHLGPPDVKLNTGQLRADLSFRFLLPINEKRISFVSTEATDYPESNFSEFNTVCQLAKNFTSRFIPFDGETVPDEKD